MDAEKLVKAFSIDEQKELLAALPLDLIVDEVGVRGYEISKGVGTTAVDSITETSTALEASADVKSLLTPEQRSLVDILSTTISEELGIEKDNLRLVIEETPEKTKRVVLADTSPNGLYVGSYNNFFGKEKNILDVNGKKVDVFAGMTDSFYRAMVQDCKSRNLPIPDSSSSRDSENIWTATMLPDLADGDVRIRRVSDGEVRRGVRHPDADDRDLRVRPAVVIAELL